MPVDRIERLFSFAAGALLSAGIAQSAFAADLPLAPRPLPQILAVNWTGLYLGGSVAGAFNSADYSRPLSGGLHDIAIGTIDSHPAFGAYAGFNYQILPWAVIGFEGSY